MQEVMKDGSEGKLIVEDTLEALLPHIRKSLEDPKVNYVKIFKGTKIEPSKGKTAFEQKDTFAAEENKKDIKPAEIIEDFLPETLSDTRKEAKLKIPGKK